MEPEELLEAVRRGEPNSGRWITIHHLVASEGTQNGQVQ